MTNDFLSKVPLPGHWPADPQTDVDVSKDRVWIDGCFDFSHHGTLKDRHVYLPTDPHIHGN